MPRLRQNMAGEERVTRLLVVAARLRQRWHCATWAGTCPLCEAWKKTTAMPEYRRR